MEIYTLNVGQGQFVVIVGKTEAFIVDTYVPLESYGNVINVKAALTDILYRNNLIGLIITGFDADHFNEIGLRIVLNKYRPNWIMYPRYFKCTDNADECFSVIDMFDMYNNLKRISVSLSQNSKRFYSNLSYDFSFEVFSPHYDDMNSSNNCSLVCKITEKSTGATYLITGDTEIDRWDSIVNYFGDYINSDVLAAPHHGSKNGITTDAIKCIDPDTVIVSAGVNNQYGHPNIEAINLFRKYSNRWYSTNYKNGQSLKTIVSWRKIVTYIF